MPYVCLAGRDAAISPPRWRPRRASRQQILCGGLEAAAAAVGGVIYLLAKYFVTANASAIKHQNTAITAKHELA